MSSGNHTGGSFNGNGSEIEDSDLEFILGQLLDDAAKAIGNTPRGELERRKAELLRSEEVQLFSEMFASHRHAGAVALNHLNNVWASRTSRAAGKTRTNRTYLRIDAYCKDHGTGGKRAATAIIPIDGKLARYVPIGEEGFIDIDNTDVADGVAAYLRDNGLRPGNMIYSHLDEHINPDNTVRCGEASVQFQPTSTIRSITDKVSPEEKKTIEDRIISELAGQLRRAGKSSDNALREDLEAIFHVKDGKYDSLYDAFEQTRFFVATLSDIARLGPARGLSILTQFEEEQRPQNGRKTRGYGKAGEVEDARRKTIKQLESIVAKHIKPPYEVYEHGVKNPESLASKVLLYRLHEHIVEYFNDGTLNAYLKQREFKPLTEGDVKRRRDLRDLIRMEWIVHGDSETYEISERNLGPVPAKEDEAALTKVWTGLHRFGVPPEYRGLEAKGNQRWRKLGRTITQDGVVINWSDPKDVKDYITEPKDNNFRELKIYGFMTHVTPPIAFEIQMMTNYMNNRNRFSDDSEHDAFKARNNAIIDFCIQQGTISQSTTDAIRFVVTNSLELRRMDHETLRAEIQQAQVATPVSYAP